MRVKKRNIKSYLQRCEMGFRVNQVDHHGHLDGMSTRSCTSDGLDGGV